MEAMTQVLTDILRMAENNRKVMSATKDPIKEILATHDIVWGVWPDAHTREGFDAMIIKGQEQVAAAQWSGLCAELRVSAIPCDSKDHALALQTMLAEQPSRLGGATQH
jgi:hypothetical protein